VGGGGGVMIRESGTRDSMVGMRMRASLLFSFPQKGKKVTLQTYYAYIRIQMIDIKLFQVIVVL
jgi:hypothetical protein